VRQLIKSAVAGLAALALSASAASAQLTSTPSEVKAGSYVLDSSHGKITWSVVHMGFSVYIGQIANVNAKLTIDPKAPTAATLDATIDMNSVGTLNAALDAHMKGADFFNTAAFPTATFKATKIALTGEKTADITGDLTLLGVTKPVVVHATFMQGGPNPMSKAYQLGFAGSAVIKRSEFGMTKYVPMISDEVTLTLEAEFRAAPAN